MHHSQHEIEKYLEARFDKPGTFLEIGCWDGELISQTFWLERERGWKGVCVDPFPRNFEARTCLVIPVAVAKDNDFRTFVKVTIDRRDGGDVSYFSGFKDSIKEHWPLISEHCDYKEMTVSTMSISSLLSIYGKKHIDFFSVDTEGAELEIFKGIDFSNFTFGMIVFEHNTNTEVKDGVGEILLKAGYVLLASLRCDDIYVQR